MGKDDKPTDTVFSVREKHCTRTMIDKFKRTGLRLKATAMEISGIHWWMDVLGTSKAWCLSV